MKAIKKKYILVGALLVVAIIVIAIFSSRKFEPKVLSVSPANGTQNIELNSLIDISFENPVPETERQKFFVRIIPGVSGDQVWVSSKLLSITPTNPLASETSYQISVLYDGENIHSSSFRTKFIKKYSEEEIQELHDMALEVSSAFYQIDETYPFLKKLPLETDSFRVVFDFDQRKFRVRLKMPSTVPDETKQEAEQSALSALQAAEVDITPYGHYVLFSE